jgi:hypothetical protein
MASEPVDFGEQCLYRELGYALQRHDRCLSGVLATFTQSHWPECLLPINNLLDDDAQCLPVIIGASRSARRSSTASNDGVRDSAQSWRELLLDDLQHRGLAMAPELAVADGALGTAGGRGGLAEDPRPALLRAQHRQRLE